jgi:predicted transcriptional regulator
MIVRKVEGEILQIILKNSTTGIGHIELAKMVGLNRKNLTPYTRRLIQKKLIRRESGKQGKYYSTEEAYKDARLSAHVFGGNLTWNLLRKRKYFVTNDERLEVTDNTVPGWYCLNFTGYRHYFEPKFREEDRLEHFIFEFSNLIGAFLTFVLIQATNPKNNQIISSKENVERDELIQDWIKSAVSSIIPDLVGEFRDSIYQAMGKYQLYYEKTRLMKRKFKYSLSRFDSADAEKAFTRVYPLLGYELKKMITDLLSERESFIDTLWLYVYYNLVIHPYFSVFRLLDRRKVPYS